jgi:hypothetical protein
MPATMSQVVNQFQPDWTRQREPDASRRACHTRASQWRQRRLDPVVTRQRCFVQIRHGNTACTHLRPLTQWAVTAAASCQARMQLPLRVCHQRLRPVRDRLPHEPLEEGRWFGPRTLWGDGASFARPATPELRAHCGPPGGQQPGGGFPVAPLMALVHAGSGRVREVFAAPLRTHDRSQVGALHPALHPGDVLGADRGVCSSAHSALLVQRGGHSVFRVHQKLLVDFPPGRPHLRPPQATRKGQQGKPRARWGATRGACDHRVEWRKPLNGPEWMDAAQCAPLPEDLSWRELRSQVHRQGFRVKTRTLVTTLMQAERSSAEAWSALSFARGGSETTLAHLNTTMGLAVLQGTTGEGVRKELSVCALTDNLVRLVMGQAARRQHVGSDRISFIDAVRWCAAARDDASLPTLVGNPHRPNRYEPRGRKRRPKQYPLMKNTRQVLRK